MKENKLMIMKPIGLLIVGGALFAFSGLAVAYTTMGTSAVGFYRMVFGGLALAAVSVYQKKRFFVGWRPLIYSSMAGFFLALDLYMWHKSIRMVGPGLGSILTNCQAFALSVFAILLFKERPTWLYYLSLVLAFFGIALIVRKDWVVSNEYQTGVWLGLASAVAYAVCVVLLKYSQNFKVKLDPVPNMVCLSFTSALFLLATSVLDGENLIIPDTRNLSGLLIYGFFVQGLAWLMVAYAVPHVKASLAGLILLSEPVLTYLVDILFLSTKADFYSILGCAVTMMAIYIGSQWGSKKSVLEVRPNELHFKIAE